MMPAKSPASSAVIVGRIPILWHRQNIISHHHRSSSKRPETTDNARVAHIPYTLATLPAAFGLPLRLLITAITSAIACGMSVHKEFENSAQFLAVEEHFRHSLDAGRFDQVRCHTPHALDPFECAPRWKRNGSL